MTTTNTTRRAILAGIATATAAAPALAAGGPDPIGPNDRRMLEAEAEYHAINRQALAVRRQDDEDDILEPFFERLRALEEEIYSLPADGYPGLACKSRMIRFGDEGGYSEDAYQCPPEILEDHGRSALHLDLQRLAGRA